VLFNAGAYNTEYAALSDCHCGAIYGAWPCLPSVLQKICRHLFYAREDTAPRSTLLWWRWWWTCGWPVRPSSRIRWDRPCHPATTLAGWADVLGHALAYGARGFGWRQNSIARFHRRLCWRCLQPSRAVMGGTLWIGIWRCSMIANRWRGIALVDLIALRRIHNFGQATDRAFQAFRRQNSNAPQPADQPTSK